MRMGLRVMRQVSLFERTANTCKGDKHAQDSSFNPPRSSKTAGNFNNSSHRLDSEQHLLQSQSQQQNDAASLDPADVHSKALESSCQSSDDDADMHSLQVGL